MGVIWGYQRVSTFDQSTDLQTDALVRVGVSPERIFTDTMSGAKGDRPGLAALMAALEPGDTLCVWRLDRLGRSVINLANILEELRDRNIELRSITEGIDTGTAAGRMIYGCLSSLSAYEREVTIERVRAGMSAAKRRGVHVGRRRGLTTGQADHARELKAQGKSLGEIAAVFRVSRSTVHRALQR